LASWSVLKTLRETISINLGCCLRHRSLSCRRSHLKLVYNVESFLHIQSQRLETRMYEDLTLLRNHVFSNDVEICKRFMHKCGNIIGSLKNFSIHVAVDKVE